MLWIRFLNNLFYQHLCKKQTSSQYLNFEEKKSIQNLISFLLNFNREISINIFNSILTSLQSHHCLLHLNGGHFGSQILATPMGEKWKMFGLQTD